MEYFYIVVLLHIVKIDTDTCSTPGSLTPQYFALRCNVFAFCPCSTSLYSNDFKHLTESLSSRCLFGRGKPCETNPLPLPVNVGHQFCIELCAWIHWSRCIYSASFATSQTLSLLSIFKSSSRLKERESCFTSCFR